MIDTNFIYIIQNDKFFEYTHTYHDEDYLLENYYYDIMFDTQNNLFKTLMWNCCEEIINKARFHKPIKNKMINLNFCNDITLFIAQNEKHFTTFDGYNLENYTGYKPLKEKLNLDILFILDNIILKDNRFENVIKTASILLDKKEIKFISAFGDEVNFYLNEYKK